MSFVRTNETEIHIHIIEGKREHIFLGLSLLEVLY